jgi:quercetin dioxygenase-like cupin family protein
MSQSPYQLVRGKTLRSEKPETDSKEVKVWCIKQNEIIRINLVRMSGELSLHQHPDAEHSLLVLEGRLRVQIDEAVVEIGSGDFISIPAGVPHKYTTITESAELVSMDAPYYDPAKTVLLE